MQGPSGLRLDLNQFFLMRGMNAPPAAVLIPIKVRRAQLKHHHPISRLKEF
jgi:hypothetical protein